jgi:hypothetical protein
MPGNIRAFTPVFAGYAPGTAIRYVATTTHLGKPTITTWRAPTTTAMSTAHRTTAPA